MFYSSALFLNGTHKIGRHLFRLISVLLLSFNAASLVQAQHVVVITGARLVNDGGFGGGGGGDGDSCQGKIRSHDFRHLDRGVVNNCYTPFPTEFDPVSGGVYARDGSNDARCVPSKETLNKVTSQSSEIERRKVAVYVMKQFDLGNGWGATEGQTSLKVIYADGGMDFWGIKKSNFLPGFQVLNVVRSNPSNGQIKPRTTPCG